MSEIVGTYIFRRAQGIGSFFSKNRANTDALSVLTQWAEDDSGRKFEKVSESDAPDQLIAKLTTDSLDADDAGMRLDALSRRYGIAYEP